MEITREWTKNDRRAFFDNNARRIYGLPESDD